MTAFPEGTILGYPRIGRRRELKKAVEAFWAGRIDEQELERTAADLRAATRERLAALGLGRTDSSIPESFSFYDQVLDAAATVGAIPARFDDLREADGTIGLSALFTVARGEGERAPLEMTKWFDSNYHYLVPEIGPETAFSLASDRLVREVAEAAAAGFVTRPVVVGPVTLLALAKASDDAPEGFEPLSRLEDVLPVYVDLLARLRAAGAEWVQLDEPALVSESLPATTAQLASAAERALAVLGSAEERPSILVAAPYASLGETFGTVAAAPIEAIAVDLVRGAVPEAVPGLEGKTLVGGVIDGHNIWRGDLSAAFDSLEALRALGAPVSAATSTSLLHVPHDVEDETALDERLVSWLAFADQKVQQVVTLARGLSEGRTAIATELDAATAALQDRLSAPGVRDGAVRSRALTDADFARAPYAEREEAQNVLGLPVLPLTTIGSFPQTGDIRRARAQFLRGEIPEDDYEEFLRREVAAVVSLQEDLGLDVLVHGEPERNDMVQYFAEHLDGFAVTQHGWVQSYGSRATRPSILWGDVSRPAPITVAWSAYAQSLTAKHMKGMLTGPVTILAWSFVRDDQPLGETANQVALALRDEIADLEAAGIQVIQVDEPALRELLPLKQADQPAYLGWSVASFRLATGGAAAATQVHTHLCYSEFGVVIDAIRALDADVTSIEAARSRMEVVADIAEVGFDHGIGPGVYDIHSPRVPTVEEVESLLRRAVEEIPLRQLWVNPDCGLKTRGYAETTASLRNIVEATRRVREDVVVTA
ncbi:MULTISPECIES: 5-methyltetrahydropteroyltriglutamate--homocysteine S-methyltransferase [unclassified Microbacterium]|uniref:5-methyltetrahydropteroyltriglutamate-- homocysteine S-methyltransferase n=1 Tax=unclassified Microbacterium TaxID=2609290 RepID=UPI0024697BAA|nr:MULTISPECIES: 5-methyltetrahydropteroyltriglutamate--homocysteine S-methyltransferase [unclassified Microbacterium]MDH5133345.1 5-methyltetrahydropteroyltriglutamate--homocysteine S-methyltransferase [Microbacterium sp. RD10]MDH5137118.1 5-methyltetrahydropteroyltriglutamate--homocysteine S-methyltransferase [Microbacterium sp. RD11]MDH5145917.1 5-methyltetrahydropteroyltriglutamate--homocysteine S-methyltransferase [Microbacterium sp. RD12]MDH5155537.1 5-methyltetrahydropteroyltriglutamate-